MMPTIILHDGEFYLTLGSPGGTRIISAVFNVLYNKLVHGYCLESAIAAPRLHAQWYPEKMIVDGEELLPFSNTVEYSSYGIGAVTAIVKEKEDLVGVVDPRREGAARGY
jgi:gamma-glutamyltranspeptidase/glutathione hydrolase